MTHGWRDDCEIIEGYMPPHPTNDTRAKAFVVRYKPTGQFLRYSRGPKQGHGWDVYGDDYQTRDLAITAINTAPPPRLNKGPAQQVLERRINRAIEASERTGTSDERVIEDMVAILQGND